MQKPDVLLTVDARSCSPGMVELAMAMAASSQTQLRALFIEDEDLLDVASLPFSREILFSTAQELPTDFERMQRSLQALAAQFENTLQRSARNAKVSYSYDYVRGRRDDIGLREHQDAVFTILGQTLLRRPGVSAHSRTHKLLLIDDHAEHLEKALQVLLQRFAQDVIEITLVTRQPDPSQRAEALLATSMHDGQKVSITTAGYETLSTLLHEIGHQFDYAIISRHESVQNLQQIIKQLDCPLILVS